MRIWITLWCLDRSIVHFGWNTRQSVGECNPHSQLLLQVHVLWAIRFQKHLWKHTKHFWRSLHWSLWRNWFLLQGLDTFRTCHYATIFARTQRPMQPFCNAWFLNSFEYVCYVLKHQKFIKKNLMKPTIADLLLDSSKTGLQPLMKGWPTRVLLTS